MPALQRGTRNHQNQKQIKRAEMVMMRRGEARTVVLRAGCDLERRVLRANVGQGHVDVEPWRQALTLRKPSIVRHVAMNAGQATGTLMTSGAAAVKVKTGRCWTHCW